MPADSLCGTYLGSLRHYKQGEKPCQECRVAAAKYQRDRRLRIKAKNPKPARTHHITEQLRAFWAKTLLTGNCMVWTGSKTHNGYGEFRKVRAHRWIYEQCVGPLTRGVLLLHSCDNRLCVKLQHLTTGDDKQNAQDAVQKGRTTRGEKNAQAKLNWKIIEEIRSSILSRKEIAKKYNITETNIGCILRGETWRR